MTEIKDSPTVSVIIPTYNRAHMVGRAIQSILNQTYQDFELIVVDDGSTDNTEEVVKSFRNERLQYIRHEQNSGGSAVPRNTGLKAARGEYIAILDSDDIWFDKDKLKKQVEFLDAHPDYVLVGTNAIRVDENGSELFRSFLPEKDEEIRGKMLQRCCVIHSTSVYRKSAAEQVGGYDARGNVKKGRVLSWEWDLWLKLGAVGKLANLPDYGVKYTMQAHGITAHSGVISRLMDIQLITRYRQEYPYYWRAIGVQSAVIVDSLLTNILNLPPFLAVQNLLKRRFPAFWRVISACNRTIRQGILSVLTGFHRQ